MTKIAPSSSETTWLRARLTGQLDGGWSWRNEFSANKSNRVFRNSESAVFVAPANIARDQTLITHDQDFWLNRFDATHNGTLGGMSNRFVAVAHFFRDAHARNHHAKYYVLQAVEQSLQIVRRYRLGLVSAQPWHISASLHGARCLRQRRCSTSSWPGFRRMRQRRGRSR